MPVLLLGPWVGAPDFLDRVLKELVQQLGVGLLHAGYSL